LANVTRLSKATPETIADYGEMVVFANEGMVTAEADRAFNEALKLDPKLPKARYFHGLALKQEGKTEEARAMFQALLADSPPDASWRPAIEAELAPDQAATIRSMVDGLEARLQTDRGDLEGWQRLIRSRSVLGEIDKAKAALATAREQFKDKQDALATLNGLAKEVGIE
jgi:cytochrome c-type biogenesis protein CcmH